MNYMLVVTQTSFKSQSIFETMLSVSKNQIYTGTFFHVPISQQQKVKLFKLNNRSTRKGVKYVNIKSCFF